MQTNQAAGNPPKVSILVPNLNYREYLDIRLQTVLAQTIDDWELIIVDNYSDDGSWELFQEYAAREPRIRLSQAPRNGMYANWNNCIELARGDYIYIATSDDTMSPTCLETMVGGLDNQPQCDICHCSIDYIDDHGDVITGRYENTAVYRYFGELMERTHIRHAPHDAILHCVLQTVYMSITQLLIRRSLFERVGLFRTDWGSKGDFEWGMRAAFVANTLHVPEKLATWRYHEGQATIQSPDLPQHYSELLEMAESAIAAYLESGNKLGSRLSPQRLLYPYRCRRKYHQHVECNRLLAKIMYLCSYPGSLPQNLYWAVLAPFRESNNTMTELYDIPYILRELRRLNPEELITVLD